MSTLPTLPKPKSASSNGSPCPTTKSSVVSITTDDNSQSSFLPEAEARVVSNTSSRRKKRKALLESLLNSPNAGNLYQLRKRGHNATLTIPHKPQPSTMKSCCWGSVCRILRVLTKGDDTMLNDLAENSQKKNSKAFIFTRSIEYISHLEDFTKRLKCEAIALKAWVAAFENLARFWC